MDAPAEASAAMRPAPICVPGGDRLTADRELRRAYEWFLTSRRMPPGVRRMVADSWQRCAASGMLPGNGRLPPLRMTSQALSEYRRTHPLAPLLPTFRDLLGAGAADDGHVFAIGDADGTLLWVEGDRQTMRRAERMRFVEGAVWSEAQAGTNAPGTVLAVGQPVQILSAEHYNCAVHAWSCAAAPVREPGTGRVLGVVDLTGGATIATPPALAAVRAAALAAEAQLAGRLIAATRLTAVTTPLPLSAAGVSTTAMAELTALGRDSALLETTGHVHRLSRRHSEIVVVLALAGRGLTGERLALELSEREVPPSTLRAEMTRLRAVLGPDLLGSRPYELLRPVRTDFGDLSVLLAEGRVREAMALYEGPLLPCSDAPAVVERRRALEQQLRGAVLGSADAGLLRRWVDAAWGADDGPAWLALAHRLPGGSPQRAAAAARARALDGESAAAPRGLPAGVRVPVVPPQVRTYAALMQRRRS
ncbi:transcriptional regulator [Streptomyces umbrinus]|uniref:GAF domain-containing protein n=1 Tax=Streptomyces umbrinus TaxID=67370 RepID=UPI0019B65D30|nr:GAF domain-containing protein [Streptomyces umbrinus]GHB31875.1 transcriptional regulator [Streptomyces umbrinus]